MKRNIPEQRPCAITFCESFYRNIMHGAKLIKALQVPHCSVSDIQGYEILNFSLLRKCYKTTVYIKNMHIINKK
jgi:hypothetical protein